MMTRDDDGGHNDNDVTTTHALEGLHDSVPLAGGAWCGMVQADLGSHGVAWWLGVVRWQSGQHIL